jgi:hypothetical protein
MESSAWALITKDSEHETNFTFSILKSCPVKDPIHYLSLQEESQSQQLERNMPNTPDQSKVSVTSAIEPLKLKRKSKAPLSVSEVRSSLASTAL